MKLLQKSMLLGRISMSVNKVIPVVVKPLTVSKYESRKVEPLPIKKGKQPNRDNTIHAEPQINIL